MMTSRNVMVVLAAIGLLASCGGEVLGEAKHEKSLGWGPRDPMARFQNFVQNSLNPTPLTTTVEHSRARAEAPSLNMAVFGDSLGAATFAGTHIGEALRVEDAWRLLRAISLQYRMPADDPAAFLERVKSIAGYERYNGFTGTQAWSHRERIQGVLGGPVAGWNYAVPGSRTDHLSRQVAKFAADFQHSPYAPAYIAISIGGNDFCQMVPREQAVRSLFQSIREIRAVLPQSLILISGVPDIVSIYQNYDRVAFTMPGFKMTCRQRVQRFPMCDRESALLSGDSRVIAAARQDLLGYQRSFAELAQRIESEFPREGPVRYAPLPVLPSDGDILAADCFHPGVEGHRRIAEATWSVVAKAFNSETSRLPAPSR
jgi:lysophospholipase L1-like esterase